MADEDDGPWQVCRVRCWWCGHRYVSVHPWPMAVEGWQCSRCGMMVSICEEHDRHDAEPVAV